MRNLALTAAFAVASFTGPAAGQQTLNFNDSPMNFKNSEMNFENSPMNFRNSPMNFDNSSMNFNAKNGVYDPNGNRIGYEVKTPSGVINIFDNDGNRVGYVPAGRTR